MIPIGDTAPRRTTPYVTYALIAANILVFLYEVSLGDEIDAFFFDWAIIPLRITRYFENPGPADEQVLLTPLTAMFLHGGWLHLAGNMLYLWIFGDNIEDALGHMTYLLFYILSGLGAAAAQIAISPDERIPMVGASGAIAGVLGAYMVRYPTAMVVVIVPFFLFFTTLVPALILIGLWFAIQLLSGLAAVGDAMGGAGGVAWFAHVGGFVTGLLLIFIFPKRQQRPTRLYEGWEE